MLICLNPLMLFHIPNKSYHEVTFIPNSSETSKTKFSNFFSNLHFRFSCCFKVRKNIAETKLNALLSNRKVYFLKGRPSHESLVLCVKYETLYKAQYLFQGRFLQMSSIQCLGKY